MPSMGSRFLFLLQGAGGDHEAQAVEQAAVSGWQLGAVRVAVEDREEGHDEIADWFETLAKAERSHANRYAKALAELVD